MDYINDAGMNLREAGLMEAARAAESRADVKTLKEKYSSGESKIYEVTTTVQVDDETEEEFTFLFHKPKPASYDRYVKTISSSVTKASKSFVFDNIVEEQKAELKETVEEYPAMTISLADKAPADAWTGGCYIGKKIVEDAKEEARGNFVSHGKAVIYAYLPPGLLPGNFEDLTFKEFFDLYACADCVREMKIEDIETGVAKGIADIFADE